MAWVGRDLKDHEAPMSLLQAGPPTFISNSRPGCPGPHPTWPWIRGDVPQGWGIHNLSGQPVPAPHHSLGKELPLNIQPKSSLFQLKTIPPCPDSMILLFEEECNKFILVRNSKVRMKIMFIWVFLINENYEYSFCFSKSYFVYSTGNCKAELSFTQFQLAQDRFLKLSVCSGG